MMAQLLRNTGLVQRYRRWIMIVSAMGIGHFVIGFALLGCWLRAAAAPSGLSVAVFALPYALLLAGYGFSFLLAWQRQRMGAAILVVTCAFTLMLAVYDVVAQRYQVHVTTAETGSAHIYVFWWWYGLFRW